MILYHSITCDADDGCDPPRTVDCSPRLPVVLDGCPIGDPAVVGGVATPTPAVYRRRIHEPGDPHDEHVTHMHPAHGGGIECSCGATLGVVCTIPDFYGPPSPLCGDCLYWRRKRLREVATGLRALVAASV